MASITFKGNSAVTNGTTLDGVLDLNQFSFASPNSAGNYTLLGMNNGLPGTNQHNGFFNFFPVSTSQSRLYRFEIRDSSSTPILAVTGIDDLLTVDQNNILGDTNKLAILDHLQTLFGGDDSFFLDGQVREVFGDYRVAPSGGTTMMGDDIIAISGALSIYGPTIYGDAQVLQAGRTAVCGDDRIDMSELGSTLGAILFGDIKTVAGTITYGDDQIYGGNGDDFIYGDSLSANAANGGNDKLYGGFGNDTLVGGGGNDLLTGFTGSDTLNGGAGNDTLQGSGSDTFIGGSGTDVASYADRGITSGSSMIADLQTPGNNTGFALGGTYAGIESITGRDQDLTPDDLRGDGNANALKGMKGNDILNGRGGADMLNGGLGSDTLTGGTGGDKFVFAYRPSTTNVDTITAFDSLDKIVLDDDVFTGIGSTFDASEFRSIATGTSFATVDSSDRIIFQKSTGKLYYDADGSGSTARVHFCTLTGSPTLDFSDFILIG